MAPGSRRHYVVMEIVFLLHSHTHSVQFALQITLRPEFTARSWFLRAAARNIVLSIQNTKPIHTHPVGAAYIRLDSSSIGGGRQRVNWNTIRAAIDSQAARHLFDGWGRAATHTQRERLIFWCHRVCLPPALALSTPSCWSTLLYLAPSQGPSPPLLATCIGFCWMCVWCVPLADLAPKSADCHFATTKMPSMCDCGHANYL